MRVCRKMTANIVRIGDVAEFEKRQPITNAGKNTKVEDKNRSKITNVQPEQKMIDS